MGPLASSRGTSPPPVLSSTACTGKPDGEGVDDCDADCEAVADCEAERDPELLCVRLCDAVVVVLADTLGLAVGLRVGERLPVFEGLRVRLWLPDRVPVCVRVRVIVPLCDDVCSCVCVGETVGVREYVCVRLWLCVSVGACVLVFVCVVVPAHDTLNAYRRWARKGSCRAHVVPSSRLTKLAYAAPRPAAGTLLFEPQSTPYKVTSAVDEMRKANVDPIVAVSRRRLLSFSGT